MFMLLFGGYWVAIEKKFVDHRRLMTYMFWTQTTLNIIMVRSFVVIPVDVNFIPYILIATLIYLLILYTYFVMNKWFSQQIMIPKKHPPMLMRINAVFWGITILSGFLSYLVVGM